LRDKIKKEICVMKDAQPCAKDDKLCAQAKPAPCDPKGAGLCDGNVALCTQVEAAVSSGSRSRWTKVAPLVERATENAFLALVPAVREDKDVFGGLSPLLKGAFTASRAIRLTFAMIAEVNRLRHRRGHVRR
ncbi:MAG: hypothetical protein ACMG6S_15345, partial [Byssovorax sp.]